MKSVEGTWLCSERDERDERDERNERDELDELDERERDDRRGTSAFFIEDLRVDRFLEDAFFFFFLLFTFLALQSAISFRNFRRSLDEHARVVFIFVRATHPHLGPVIIFVIYSKLDYTKDSSL